MFFLKLKILFRHSMCIIYGHWKRLIENETIKISAASVQTSNWKRLIQQNRNHAMCIIYGPSTTSNKFTTNWGKGKLKGKSRRWKMKRCYLVQLTSIRLSLFHIRFIISAYKYTSYFEGKGTCISIILPWTLRLPHTGVNFDEPLEWNGRHQRLDTLRFHTSGVNLWSR